MPSKAGTDVPTVDSSFRPHLATGGPHHPPVASALVHFEGGGEVVINVLRRHRREECVELARELLGAFRPEGPDLQ